MSKEIRPGRLGKSASKKKRIITWSLLLLLAGAGGVFAAYHYTGTTEVEVAVVALARLLELPTLWEQTAVPSRRPAATDP